MKLTLLGLIVEHIDSFKSSFGFPCSAAATVKYGSFVVKRLADCLFYVGVVSTAENDGIDLEIFERSE